MPTPMHLSDEEMDVLLGLAEPIAYGRRDEFLQAVAATLGELPAGRTGRGLPARERAAEELRARGAARKRQPSRGIFGRARRPAESVTRVWRGF
jgi:hypothetical protein